MEYFLRKERKEKREITPARWLLQRHLDARLAITFLHALPLLPRYSSSFVSFDHVFSPTRATISFFHLSNDIASLVSPGAEVCSDRGLSPKIRARAGKLVSSFRVRRGRKRDFSRSSVDDSSKVGDNSFVSFAAVQSKSLSYLRFRRTLRVNFLAWRDNLVAKSLSTACRSSLQPELILSKERDETRYASRSEERR